MTPRSYWYNYSMDLFRIQDDNISKVNEKSFSLEKDLQILTEKNLPTLFDLQFVSGKLNKQFTLHNFEIDTLAFDQETQSFVIIEYKKEQSFSVVDQGFNYLALMLNNKAEFILEYSERCSLNLRRDQVDWSQSRVIFIAPSFTPHQRGAIAFKDLPIELWEAQLYEGSLVSYSQIKPLEIKESITKVTKSQTVTRVSQEVQTPDIEDHVSKLPEELQELYKSLREKILALDHRIKEKVTSSYVGYKTHGSTFTYVNFRKDYLDIAFRTTKPADTRLKVEKPRQRGWDTTPIWNVVIRHGSDLSSVITLVTQAYEYYESKYRH